MSKQKLKRCPYCKTGKGQTDSAGSHCDNIECFAHMLTCTEDQWQTRPTEAKLLEALRNMINMWTFIGPEYDDIYAEKVKATLDAANKAIKEVKG